MAAMSCRKPPKKDDDHGKSRRKKCDRERDHHGRHGDRRKKCKSHDNPWKQPVGRGRGGPGGPH
jgi:hypothetical protein